MSSASARSALLAGAALLFAVAIASALERWAPFPAAAVERGTEEPFASGLFPRELPPRGVPLRWTRERATFRFVNLPRGALELQVAIHGQRAPVAVAANGVVVGLLEPGMTGRAFPVPVLSGRLDVELRTPGFRAGDGRVLGTLLDRVTVRHPRDWIPPLSLVLVFVVPALALLVAARLAALPAALGAAVAVLVVVLEALALVPGGIVRSPYAVILALSLVLGGALAGAFARFTATRDRAAPPFAFVAVLAAFLVQGIAATSPVMVVSDVVFHANKLMAVAAGDWFPTSVTQHTPPFRIPYGVSFYALLTPLARLGVDPVWAVRIGAASAGVVASLGLFLLALPLGAARAAAATVFLQLLPATFEVPYSHGNLSNGFAQAMTVLFFAWWTGATPGGWLVGALTFVLAGLGHLSSLVVLLALAAGLVLAQRTTLVADRSRRTALGTGLAVTALYFACFAPLVAEQLPRLFEGPGQGRTGSRAVGEVLWLQMARLVEQWGLPALLLGLVGSPFGKPLEEPHAKRLPEPIEPSEEHRADLIGLHRALAAFWWAGLALAAAAIVSPLEVRYLYALTLPLALAAASGAALLWKAGGMRRAVVVVALGAQIVLAARGLAESVLYRYRP